MSADKIKELCEILLNHFANLKLSHEELREKFGSEEGLHNELKRKMGKETAYYKLKDKFRDTEIWIKAWEVYDEKYKIEPPKMVKRINEN